MAEKMEPGSLGALIGIDVEHAEACSRFFTLGFLVRSSLSAVIKEEGLSLFDRPVEARTEYIRRRAIKIAKAKIQQPLGLDWVTDEILQAAFAFGDQLFYGCLG